MDKKWRSQDGYSQLQAMNDDQFTRLIERAESADPQTVQALRTDLARGNDVVRAQDAEPDVGLDELVGFTLEA